MESTNKGLCSYYIRIIWSKWRLMTKLEMRQDLCRCSNALGLWHAWHSDSGIRKWMLVNQLGIQIADKIGFMWSVKLLLYQFLNAMNLKIYYSDMIIKIYNNCKWYIFMNCNYFNLMTFFLKKLLEYIR